MFGCGVCGMAMARQDNLTNLWTLFSMGYINETEIYLKFGNTKMSLFSEYVLNKIHYAKRDCVELWCNKMSIFKYAQNLFVFPL